MQVFNGFCEKKLAFFKAVCYYVICLWDFKGLVYRKGVNQSNEGRNPSQLSADYY